MKKVIDLKINEKAYRNKKQLTSVLNNFRLNVNKGEKVSIVGRSGVGKTTLLNILGLLDTDYDGEYMLFDSLISNMESTQLAKWRNQKIGFVLQESALINSITIEENIKLPLQYADSEYIFKEERFNEILNKIGIESILKKKPLECSGGEKSRAIFARAIIMNPSLILCDEPTASLDEYNKQQIMNLLFKMNKEQDVTIVTVTHDMNIASQHDRIIKLERNV
ncbi:ABC transporter ATP-binding protein [Anaerococcus martiniensis]|uniref:ABC transporter ATP-binding protein n=1 Tax=Anaerococcus sp. WGS1579 TaxID=3366809 RepID=UPI00372CF5D0